MLNVKMLTLDLIAASQCTLPLSDGTWYSSSRGTWTVSSSGLTVTNFDAKLSPYDSNNTLTCVTKTGDRYILGYAGYVFFSSNIYV